MPKGSRPPATRRAHYELNVDTFQSVTPEAAFAQTLHYVAVQFFVLQVTVNLILTILHMQVGKSVDVEIHFAVVAHPMAVYAK